MRVAIFYDSTLTPDVRLLSDSGFHMGYTDSGRVYSYQTETYLTAVNVARHVNLKFNGTRYVKASSESDTTVGCYHIKVQSDENYRDDEALLREAFPDHNVFSASYDGKFYVMIGQFYSVEKANKALEEIIKLISPTIIIPPPPETTEPDSTEPDSTEPDSTEPDSTEPDSTEPDSTEPDSTEPDSTEPDSTEPDSTEPDSTEPDSTEPDSTEPDSTESDSTESDSTEPDSTEPDSTEPDSTEPDSTEPDSTEPDSTEPDSTEPDSTEPDSTEPDSTEPDSTEPESTEPESTEPETSETETTTQEPIIVPPEVYLPEEVNEAVLNATVHTPNYACMVVINPATHKIIWSYNTTSGQELFAIGPIEGNMRAYHGSSIRYYDGVFECAGFNPTGYFGVRVVNLVRLERYVAGVCSAEIPTWWPIETLKAFTIAARSFAVKTLYGHGGSYNADVCNTACCQVFNGYGPTDERVWRAAKETNGIIAKASGRVCGTYYSSSTGGCTANCTDVWGSSLATYPYLKAVATPWEKYKTYSRGYKVYTVTGTSLYNRLEDQGYTALNGAVTNVKITATGDNTTYVTQIQFYDAAGNVVTVNRADRIKKLLSAYVDSANFVVAKSGDKVSMTSYTMLGFGAVNPDETTGVDILGHPFLYKVFGRQFFSVITSKGLFTFKDSTNEKVLTGTGLKDFNMSYSLDSQIYPTVTGINGEELPDIHKLSGIVYTETVSTDYAANSFTFISRGWGHGVGMSQYGIYELGNLGYDYEYILSAYYTGISFVKYMGE